MNANSENNSDKEKEAEIATNRLVEMLGQQALYARIAKINEKVKGGVVPEDEESDNNLLSLAPRSSNVVLLRWAVAASLIIGILLFFLKEEVFLAPPIAIENIGFRGTEYTQSRSVINGKPIRRAYADIDDLIDAGEFDKAKELLKKNQETIGTLYRNGIIAFLTNDFSAAAAAFHDVVESEDLEYLENAYWNLLLSHKETGSLLKTKEVAQEMQSNKYITRRQKARALKLVE